MSIDLKGFEVVFGNELKSSNASHAQDKQDLLHLSLESIRPNHQQPRKCINDNELQELTDSVKSQGILQPIIVRKKEEQYEIVAGERRWRAAKLAGLTSVPAICKEITDETALVLGLMENIQRSDLNPLEEAIAIQQLVKDYHLTHEQVSYYLGKSRSAITNMLRVLKLTEEVRQRLAHSEIELGHAKLLISLDEKAQCRLARLVYERNLSVRALEKLILEERKPQVDKTEEQLLLEKKAKEYEASLSQKIHSQVKVRLNGIGQGSVVIQVNSLEELEWLIENFHSSNPP